MGRPPIPEYERAGYSFQERRFFYEESYFANRVREYQNRGKMLRDKRTGKRKR